MKYMDDPELIKRIGISLELMEHSQIEAPIYKDTDKSYNWSLYIHPPIDRTDIMYFQIYDNAYNNGQIVFNTSR